MKWRPAFIDGVTYDLSHLHPFSFALALDARGELPAITFTIHVTFGLHCFTKDIEVGCDPAHHYDDARGEIRCFCANRHEMSLALPEIIRSLNRRRCYEAKHNNYMTFELQGANGNTVHYQVYFKVTRSGLGENALTLFVQSAYPKDVPQKVQRAKPCLFKAICAEVVRKKK